jgi:single-stranded-DNA-specific exonuclease
MEKACVRIYDAVEKGEKIVIYSDYDCDGIPAAVIMHDFFKKISFENFSIYIPDRHGEGYGLHTNAIEEFIKDNVNLIITFDLGITAVKEVKRASEAGIDVIITDHHLPHDEIPEAFAIINPKQDGCDYPDKMLCGAGLAFKLVQALTKKYGTYWQEKYPDTAGAIPRLTQGWEKWLLDMAGLATLADQVPLVNENRLFAYYGLKVLQKARRPGLAELFRKAGVDVMKMNEEDVTFTLAPRLNAASRMASPMRAFQVLATIDAIEARTHADHLAKINDERKSIVATIMKDVNKKLQLRDHTSVIVIGNPEWRVGILGLVAAKVAEEYKVPTFVWGSYGSDVIRGSCRLPNTYKNGNIVSLMTALPAGSLLEFGGHAGAGGFSVSHEEVHFLQERLDAICSALPVEEETSEYMIDAVITLDDVTPENYSVIEKLAPYGTGNPKPMFRFEKVVPVLVKEFGKEKNHLELAFVTSRGRPVKAIAFFKTRESYTDLSIEKKPIDLIATFEKSTFAGRTELRLRIVDIL